MKRYSAYSDLQNICSKDRHSGEATGTATREQADGYSCMYAYGMHVMCVYVCVSPRLCPLCLIVKILNYIDLCR